MILDLFTETFVLIDLFAKKPMNAIFYKTRSNHCIKIIG